MGKNNIVGMSIPNLNLPDTRGRMGNLKRFVGHNNVVLLLLKGIA